MRPSSDSFSPVLVVCWLGLTYLGKTIFDSLVYAWFMRQLEAYLGLSEARMIADFSAVAVPSLAMALILWWLYIYIRREVTTQQQPDSLALSPLAQERQTFVRRALLGLGNAEIEWLDRILISGRPVGCPQTIWTQLENSGLVDRDFAGPKGVKEDLKHAVTHALGERRSLANALEIIVSPSSKYREAKTDPHGTTETLFVGLRNSHPTLRITNCRISLKPQEDISAYTWLLQGGFALESGDEKLIPVAHFREFSQPHPPHLDRIRIPVPPPGGFAKGPELPLDGAIVTLEATSSETVLRQLRCKVWLDEQRSLRLAVEP